ncbi:MAG: hypothetical protein LUG60_08555 [Erysipelotrichaceae bacterium]|nr:hypothetical protein [Erysipelotrichaceae bacterium]
MNKTICLEFGYYKTSAKLFQKNQKDIISLNVDDHVNEIQSKVLLTKKQILKLKGQDLNYEFLNTLGSIPIGNDILDNEYSYIFSKFRLPPEYFDTLYCKNDAFILDNHITRGMIISCFVYSLVNQIIKYNPDYLSENDRKNMTIVIGALKDKHWGTKEAIDKYQTLVQKATGVHEVQIILM